MPAPSGFMWEQRSSGDVLIRHHGRLATTLRGTKAARFAAATAADPERAQALMARLTGNYKRGNERQIHRPR